MKTITKLAFMTIVTIILLSIALTNDEVLIKDKFKEGHKYEVDLYYLDSFLKNPRIELRSKLGEVLIKSVEIPEGFRAENIDYFFSYDANKKELGVHVHTGGAEWSWIKNKSGEWLPGSADFSWNGVRQLSKKEQDIKLKNFYR